MLLEFRTSNYKSFKDELVFSLTPAPKQKGLDYSILEQLVKKHTRDCVPLLFMVLMHREKPIL